VDARGIGEADLTRKRVLRFITRLNVGGPAIHAALLTERLDPGRYESRLVAGHEGPREGDMLQLRPTSAVPVTRVPWLGREVSPVDDVRALASAIRLARAFRPDIVHTHLAKAGFVGRIAGRLAGARVIVHTYHGSVFRGYFGTRESRLYLAIERALARLTTRIIAITPRQRTELIDLGIASPGRITEIALGLDLSRFGSVPRDDARSALGVPRDAPLITLVGRLVTIKDIPTFLCAFAEVTKVLPDARALVVGDGTERERLVTFAAELGIQDRCAFLGWRADVETIYAASDVVALSSLNEGSPVSLIEAMAAGRAVVATSVGGVPDVVQNGMTGLLVPPADPGELAGAILRLLRDPELSGSLAERARRAAHARYGAERLVADIDRLYLSLLPDVTG
jgi:glycosyltransferase involved in cell wall biosynthesis